MPLQYLQKQGRDEVDFLHADKHQSFLQVYSNTLVGRIKHSQSTQINKFAISLQYLKKGVECIFASR